MEALVVQRWTRAGHDRLYVKTTGGYQVGYVDRRSGKRVLEDEAWRGAFDSAVASFESALDVPTLSSDATAVALEGPWVDLALNRPGQAVRAKAKQLQEAAPVATFVARVVGIHTNERAWRVGDNGEVAVAKQLARLDSRWRVLHSVPVGSGDSDIDHIVIGPAGVFTVNAKNHPNANVWVGGDSFMVNGKRRMYVHSSRYEARRASTLLSAKVGYPVPATGVIAVLGARGGFTIREQPRDGEVVVVARIEIARWFDRLPRVLSDDQVEEIYQAARRSTTWVEPKKAGTKRR